MNIDQLRTFVEVADLGSFARYAEEHWLTRTDVKRRIDSLESELGVALMARGPRGVTLTPAGTALHDKLRVLLPKLDDALEEARATGGTHIVRVATVAGSFAPGVAEALAEARQDEGFSAELVKLAGEEHIPAVTNGRCDIAFASYSGYLHGAHDGVEFHATEPVRVCAIVSPSHRLSGRPCVGIEDLLGSPIGGGFDNIERFPELAVAKDYRIIMGDEDQYATTQFVDKGGCLLIPDLYEPTILCSHTAIAIQDPGADDMAGIVIRTESPLWLQSFVDRVIARIGDRRNQQAQA